MRYFSFSAVLVAVGLVWNSSAWSEELEPPIKLTLHPAAEPRPALRYLLLPPIPEQHRGNAALTYTKQVMELRSRQPETQEKLDHWLELTVDQLPLSEMEQLLAQWEMLLEELDRGARLMECDWQIPLGERNMFTNLMDEAQECRALSRFLAVKARLQIAQRKFDEASHTLQTGFAMGQHVARGPTLVNGLIGNAISEIMLRTTQDFVEAPGAPNLYFALTALPRPLIDFRHGIEVERDILYLSYPDMREIKTREYTPDQLQPIVDRFTNDIASMLTDGGYSLPQNRFEFAALAIKVYPDAKKRLIEHGRASAQIEAMPVFQVVMIDALETYEELRDQVIRWHYLPYWEGRLRMDDAVEYLRRENRRETLPLVHVLLPALQAISAAAARTDREVAMLRIVEAIRLYAAGHEGRMPKALADITEVPLPKDPFTNQDFTYTLAGDVALLSPPVSNDTYAKTYFRQFELRMAK